ncbi:MAG: PcfJ domain-containing protein [Eubacteriales bacterium]
MPQLTDEHERLFNQHFQAYIFYYNVEKNFREGRCTACDSVLTAYKKQHMSWIEETCYRNDSDLINAKHNDNGKCPNCGTDIIYKSVGISKGRKSLNTWGRMILILPVDKNKVYARAFYVSVDYRNIDEGYDQRLYFSETARYVWQPGEWQVYKYDYDYTNYGMNQNGTVPKREFIKAKTPIEPFPAGAQGNGYYNHYVIVNEDALDETFLTYAQRDIFTKNNKLCSYENKLFKYLSLYCKHPQCEMLLKLGHRDVVDEMVYFNKKSVRMLKWEAKSPYEFFKMSKQEYNAFRAAGGTLDIFKAYKALKKNSPNSTTYDTVKKYKTEIKIHYTEFQALLIKYKIPHVRYYNYLSKNITKTRNIDDIFILHRDYIDSAELLQYDLKNEVVFFPKNLVKAHDTASTLAMRIRSENEAKELSGKNAESKKTFQDLYKNRDKQYVFSDDNYCIIQPEGMHEIIYEGKILQHCVGGYALRHAEGKTTILFMRLTGAPEIPYQTIEMQDKEKRQIQGYKNRTPLTQPGKEFVDKWLNWVEAGSPRDKEGNPTAAEEKRDRVLVAS